jgi:hypothetical protein
VKWPHPRVYGCLRTHEAPPCDGDTLNPCWAPATWSENFIDIEGELTPPLRTRVKMLWDERCLYIAAQMEEPHLWATLTNRDSVIFHDNDFEVFIDPDDDHHHYAELEINTLGTEWDLLLPKPYRDGGPAINAFDLAGLKSAVRLDGTLNNPEDTDRGWSLTIEIPFQSLAELTSRPLPPRAGERWRINFSRVEWDLEVVGGEYRKIPGRPEHNWVWSPQWAIDMHRPELWGLLAFQDEPAPVAPDPHWRERCLLMEIYWEQQRRRESDLTPMGEEDLSATGVRLLSHGDHWSASIRAADGTLLTIRQDSLLWIR